MNKENSMSPGKTNAIYGTKLDRVAETVSESSKTRDCKLHRLKLKEQRTNKSLASEVREGVTYQKEICLYQPVSSIEEIPAAVCQPPKVQLPSSEYTMVMFDLETTSSCKCSNVMYNH